MSQDLKPALFDTPSDAQVSVSVDMGIIPPGFPGAGQYVITAQVHPIRRQAEAQIILQAVKEAVESRLQVKMRMDNTVTGTLQ